MSPAEMSGSTQGGDRYPDWTKAQLMLLLLWNKLQEAYDSGDSEVRLMIVRGSDEVGVYVGTPRVNVSDEISELSRPGEAVAVFDRLWQEGYLHGGFGRGGPYMDIATGALRGLSTKGLIDIGKFPNPDERMARAFEQAARVLEQNQSIPPAEKRDTLDTIPKTVALLYQVQGLGQAVADRLGPTGGAGIG